MEERTSISLFYSWQSDLPGTTNRYAIKKGLKEAISKVKREDNLFLQFDEATRGVGGAPNIPQTILKKITSCDIFICDVTTVNKGAEKDPKTTPNPNVLFELGYAVALLGWERVIMLYNTSYGDFSKDLPFDIGGHRVSQYQWKRSGLKYG